MTYNFFIKKIKQKKFFSNLNLIINFNKNFIF